MDAVKHLAGHVIYWARIVDVVSTIIETRIRVWCDVDVPVGDTIVFEAALSDCEACQVARSKALHDVRPSAIK